jgi:diguanylate cyclase (GGDEF)-like protein
MVVGNAKLRCVSGTAKSNKDQVATVGRTPERYREISPASSVVGFDSRGLRSFHFKKFNDAKGHLAGDACLDQGFEIIKTIVGRRGRIYKWGQGGDEMSAFLPDFSTDEAELEAEKIRNTIVQKKLGDDLPVTASVGVCGTDKTESKSPEEIVKYADQAVFESKRQGRNRVTLWPFTPTDNPVEGGAR